MIDVSNANLRLTRKAFYNYKDAFTKKVNASPVLASLIITKVSQEPGTIEQFLGEQSRQSTTFTFPCLYSYTLDPFEREPIGLSKTGNAMVYLPPDFLLKHFSDYHLERTKVKVVLFNKTYIVSNIDYLYEIFDSCIAIQFTCKEEIRG